jgi:two-component system, sensor histidine kinase
LTREAILSLLDHLCNEARNSMHAVYGLMEFQPEAATGPAWQTCLDASRASADRLLQTIDDMREMLSGTAPEAASVEEFDLAKCVNETAILLNMTAGDHAAKLRVESLEEPIRIRQDRHSLEQVLVRVLNLAVKLSQGGSVRVAVSEGGMDRVGIAITPSNADLAYRLANWINADAEQVSLHQNDVPTFVTALVAGRRLHAMGGVAESACDSDEVPSLLLYLPRQIAGGGETLSSSATGQKLQVLVAEDCDESYVLTEMLLRNETVDRARHGLEAIDKIMRRRYDIVFMDVHMPGLDGYDTIRAIRQWETQSANARTPIVVLSSDDIATQKRCAAQAGCSGFLRKPIRQPELVDVLQPLHAARELVA